MDSYHAPIFRDIDRQVREAIDNVVPLTAADYVALAKVARPLTEDERRAEREALIEHDSKLASIGDARQLGSDAYVFDRPMVNPFDQRIAPAHYLAWQDGFNDEVGKYET